MIISGIEIQLRAEIARLRQDMDQARQTVSNAMSRISSAVSGAMKMFAGMALAMGGAMFAGWIKGAIDAADETKKLSQKTGIAVKDIAGVQLAFQQAGLETDKMTGAMVKLSKGIVDGNSTLDQLRIKGKTATGQFRETKDVLYEVADKFAGLNDGAKKTALAVELFGKSGADMIPLLNGGSEAMREMDAMARKLGLSISDETASKAEQFNDTLDTLQMGSQGVARQIAAELLPTLTGLAGSFLESMTSGDRLKNTAQFLASGLKLLYTVGVGIVEVFSTVGKVIGGVVAIATNQITGMMQVLSQAGSGDFSGAWDTVKSTIATSGRLAAETASDVGAGWGESARAIATAWDGSAGAAVTSLTTMRTATTQLRADSAENTKALKKEAEAYKLVLKAAEDRAAAHKREYALVDELVEAEEERLRTAVEGSRGALASAKAEYEQYGLTKSQIAEITLLTLKSTQAKHLDGSAGFEAARKQIEAQEELIGILKKGEARDASKALNDSMKQDFEETVRKYDDIFSKGFADMLNNGKDGWKSFTKSLTTTFKTSVADQLYKMFAQPFVMKIVAAIAGMGGSGLSQAAGLLGGGGESGGGFGSILSSASSLFSAGKTLFGGFSAGLSGSLGGLVSQFGSMFGSTAISSFGAGMASSPAIAQSMAATFGSTSGTGAAIGGSFSAGASAGAYAIPIAGWIAAGMALSNSLYKQGWDATNGTLNTAGKVLGSGILGLNSLLKGIGLSNSAANIFSGQATLSKLFGRKNPEITGQGIEGTFNAGGFSGQTFANVLEKGGWFRSDKNYVKNGTIDTGTDATFDDTIKNMLLAVKGFGESMGITASQIDGYSKSIKLTFTSDQAKNDEMITGVFAEIGDDLARMLIPAIDQLAKKGETAAAALQRISIDYSVVDAALESVGKAFGPMGIESIAARERLIDLTGGVEAFAQGTAAFGQTFLTEAERMAPIIAHVTSEMAAMGLSSIDTRDEFKSLVLGLDLATEAGAKQYAALIKLAPAFAQVVPQIEAVATALEDLPDFSGLVEGATRKVEQAQAGVTDALRRVGDDLAALASRAAGTAADVKAAQQVTADAYFAALDERTAAQLRVVEATRQSAGEITKAAMTFRDFAAGLGAASSGGYLSLKSQLEETAGRAKIGDEKAQQSLVALAQKFLASSEDRSSTRAGVARDEAAVKQMLNGVADALDKRASDLLKTAPGASTPVATPLEKANQDLIAAELKLLGLASAAATVGAETNVALRKTGITAADLVAQFQVASTANIKAQADLATANSLTAGMTLLSSTGINGFLGSLAALGAAQDALGIAQADLSKAIIDAAAASKVSNLDYAKSLGLTGEAAAAFAKTMDDAKLTSSGFGAIMSTTGFTASELEKVLRTSGVPAADMALMLGNASTEGGKLADRLKTAGGSAETFAADMAKYGLSPANLQTLFGLSETAATKLSEELNKGGTAVKTFREWLENSKYQGSEFFKKIEEASTAAGKIVDALKLGEGRSLKDLMKDTGKSAEELTAILNASKLTTDDFDKWIKASGLSAKALSELLGASDASGLRATVIAGGLSMKDFDTAAKALKLPLEDLKGYLDGAGLTAKEFKRIGDLTNTPLTDLGTYLATAKTSASDLATKIDNSKGSIEALALELGGKAGATQAAKDLATVLLGAKTNTGTLDGSILSLDTAVVALEVLFGDGSNAGLVRSFDLAGDSIDDLKKAMGLLGTSASAMQALMDGFKLPVITPPTVTAPPTGTATAPTTGTATGSVVDVPAVPPSAPGTGTATPVVIPPSTGSGTGGVTGNIKGGLVESAYLDVLKRAGDPGGIAFWTGQMEAGNIALLDIYKTIAMSAANSGDGTASSYTNLGAGWSVEKAVADDNNATAWLRAQGIPGFAAGGSFGGGIRIVGENGPELEATGPSRIWNAGQTKAMLGGGAGDDGEQAAEMRLLRESNERMEKILEKLLGSQGRTEGHVKESKDTLTGVVRGDITLKTTEVSA